MNLRFVWISFLFAISSCEDGADKAQPPPEQLASDVAYRVRSVKTALILYRASHGNLPKELYSLRESSEVKEGLGEGMFGVRGCLV
jgi:hypothetical protein